MYKGLQSIILSLVCRIFSGEELSVHCVCVYVYVCVHVVILGRWNRIGIVLGIGMVDILKKSFY